MIISTFHRNFVVSQYRKTSQGKLVFQKNFWYRKMLRIRERGGITTLHRKFVVSIPKNFVGETCVSEKFWYRKFLWMRMGARECHDFQMEFFCLTEPKNFVEEPFCVAENFEYRKMSRRERGGASRLYLENLLSHRTEQLRRGNLCFRKVLVSKNVKDKREGGGNRDFLSKFCCLTVQKIFVGETCVSESFWYRKMLRIRERGGITTFHRNFVVSQYRKTS